MFSYPFGIAYRLNTHALKVVWRSLNRCIVVLHLCFFFCAGNLCSQSLHIHIFLGVYYHITFYTSMTQLSSAFQPFWHVPIAVVPIAVRCWCHCAVVVLVNAYSRGTFENMGIPCAGDNLWNVCGSPMADINEKHFAWQNNQVFWTCVISTRLMFVVWRGQRWKMCICFVDKCVVVVMRGNSQNLFIAYSNAYLHQGHMRTSSI